MSMINNLFVIIALTINCYRVVFAAAALPVPPQQSPPPAINSTNNNQHLDTVPDKSSLNVPNLNATTINNDSQLMNKTFLPFLNGCNKTATSMNEAVVEDQMLCSAYFEMVIEIDTSNITDFRTQDNIQKYLLQNDEGFTKSFCDQLPEQIPNRLPKHFPNGDKTFHDVIADKQICNKICFMFTLTPTYNYKLIVKPICLLISAGYGKILANESPAIDNKTIPVKQKPEIASEPNGPMTANISKPTVVTVLENSNKEQPAVENDAEMRNKALKPFVVETDRPLTSIKSNPESVPIQTTANQQPALPPSAFDQSQNDNINNNAAVQQPLKNSNVETHTTTEANDKIPPKPIMLVDDGNNNDKQPNDDNYDNYPENGQDSDQQQPIDVDASKIGGGTQNNDDVDDIEVDPVEPINANHPLHKDMLQKSYSTDTDDSPIRHIQDPFFQGTDSNFFAYFMALMFICIVVYVLYHNKTKVIALVLEGRRSSSSGRGGSSSGFSRRKHTAAYRKLDTNLEEAITSNKCGKSAQIIY